MKKMKFNVKILERTEKEKFCVKIKQCIKKIKLESFSDLTWETCNISSKIWQNLWLVRTSYPLEISISDSK